MVNEWVADVVDIVTAFLYGNLDEEIYLKLPDRLNRMKGFENLDPREDCCVLQHAMYGLVQAARQYYKKYVDVLVTKLNFEKCLSDACLLRRKTEKGTVIVFFYVDDNCCVERSFSTAYERMRAMLNGAKLKDVVRSELWAECANLETDISNILIKKEGEKCAYELFFGEMPKYSRNMRTFGELGIFLDKGKIKGKLTNRGNLCVFLGYGRDHGSGVFRFLNIKTRKIIHSRDVKWIDKKYGDYLDEKQIKQKSNGIFYELDDEREYFTSGRDVEGEISNQNLQPGNNLEEDTSPVQEEENINLNPKVRRAL